MNSALMFSKATDEWATPQATFDALDREFKFALDAAASDDNHKCEHYIDQKMDALSCDWFSALPLMGPWSVWLNPPYSKCREFIAKAAEEARKGCTVVCLVPSRTDTRWWSWAFHAEAAAPGFDFLFVARFMHRLHFGDLYA